jgi:hypothetical protein
MQMRLSLRHSRESGNPVRRYRSLGSRIRGNDGKVLLNRCLLDGWWERPPALPCGSDACREGALQRDTFVDPSQKGSLRNPSRLTPLPRESAIQRTHAKQRSVRAAVGDSASPLSARCRAANGVQIGACGTPNKVLCCVVLKTKTYVMVDGSGLQPSPVGATRVAKARTSATLLWTLRRRGRFATLRGLRRSHRTVQFSALTRSKQESEPPQEIPPRLRPRAVARLSEFNGNAGVESGTFSRRITSLVIPA